MSLHLTYQERKNLIYFFSKLSEDKNWGQNITTDRMVIFQNYGILKTDNCYAQRLNDLLKTKLTFQTH